MEENHDLNNREANSKDLLPEFYDRLRAFARNRFANTGSIVGTELVHEAYLRIAEQGEWENTAHFLGAIRNAMKNVIVDHYRKKGRLKHGGHLQRIPLEGSEGASEPLPQLIALNDALDEFEKHDERAAKIVTLRFFGCMTEEEVCKELNISRRTAARDWAYAKAWLSKEMAELLE